MLEIFYWCAAALFAWRLVQLVSTFAGLGATEVGLGLPAELVGVQLDRSTVAKGGACGLRPVSVVVPFAAGEDPEGLARTLNALDGIELPQLEILVVTDLEHPRQLPLEGFGYEFSMEKRAPLYEQRLPAPTIAWEARVRFASRLRLLGIGQAAERSGKARQPISWRSAALNAAVNASRFPMVLWHPAGIELEPRALTRMSMAILARPDIAGVTATTLHRSPDLGSLTAALSNLRVVRRERLKASWLGTVAMLPRAPVLWRRQSVVEAGGFGGGESDEHAVFARLEQKLRSGAQGGTPQRTLPVLGAEARRFDRLAWQTLLFDEALLLAERPRWVFATLRGGTDSWRYLLALASDRLQPALEVLTLLSALAAVLVPAAAGSDLGGAGIQARWLVLAIAASLLAMIPIAVDLFVLLGDQLRFGRWSGRALLAMLLATFLNGLVVRHLVALLLWPVLLRRGVQRHPARSAAAAPSASA